MSKPELHLIVNTDKPRGTGFATCPACQNKTYTLTIGPTPNAFDVTCTACRAFIGEVAFLTDAPLDAG